MTRHLASKKAKQILTGSNIVTIPMLMPYALLTLTLGILRTFYESNLWVLSAYLIMLLGGLFTSVILLMLDKKIKRNRKFVGILGLNVLWCLGCGWWVDMVYWIFMSGIVFIIMHNYKET